MRFTKSNDVYKVIRITGAQDNILGICFSANEERNIELVEWNVKRGAKIKASGDQVLGQVLSGLKSVNEDLGKNYHLSKIYFLPSDSASNSVYEFLIKELIKQFDSGNEFLEV
jgi:hypothetical protein